MSLFGDMLITTDDRVWRALGDAIRREVLDLCSDRPRTTGELCDAFPRLGRTSVMKHLDVLEAAGLIVVRRAGRERFNVTNSTPLRRVCLPWVSRHAARVAQAVQRLREYAESQPGDVPISRPKTMQGAKRERKQRSTGRRKRRDR